MAKIKSKGTVLKQDISAQLTAIAQIITISLDGAESLTYDANTLDNTSAGIPYEPTGYSEGGSVSGELFFDPVLTGHQEMTDSIITPVIKAYEVVWADAATTPWSLSVAGLGMNFATALNDGLKATFSGKLSGLAGFTT